MQQNQTETNRLFQVFDILCIVACAVLMYRIRNSFWYLPSDYQKFLLVLLLTTFYVFSWRDIYKPHRGRWLYKSLSNLSIAWLIVALCLGMVTFFTKSGDSYSRLWFIMIFLSSYGLMVSGRIVSWNYSKNKNAHQHNQRNVVIIGAGQLGKRACDAILEEHWAGLHLVSLFDDDEGMRNTQYRGININGNVDEALAFIEQQRQHSEHAVKEVWIALPLSAAGKIQQLQSELENTATNVFLVPDLFGSDFSRYSMVESAGITLLNLSSTPIIGGLEKAKRAEDIIISLLMGVILSPILLVTAIAIKLESNGPVFFKQRRYGLDGKEILVWKFRSMQTSQDGDHVPQARPKDSRTTRVGRFIRRFSLDELPQLINVLNGTMSLVGPRPHAVAHNEYYRDKVHGYMARHKIRPGMTGWAQVNGCRGETEVIEKMQRRLRYDLEYIQNWSIALDIRILFKTLSTVMFDKNAY